MGTSLRRIAAGTGGAVLGLALLTAPAPGATPIGETFNPSPSCGGDQLILQNTSPGGSYAAASAGVITSWSHQAPVSSASALKLKVGRFAPGGSGMDYTIVGESQQESPVAGMLNTFPTRIPVQAGDVIGLYHVSPGDCGSPAGAIGYEIVFKTGDSGVGTTATFPFAVDVKLDVSAILEPDCDGDGFGDETQDPDLQSCTPPPPPKTDRTVNLDASKGKVQRGKKVTLFGKVESPQRQAACAADQTVELQRAKGTSFETFEQVQTDPQGNFLTKTKVKKTFLYRAQVPETAVCLSGVSDTEKVKAKKKK